MNVHKNARLTVAGRGLLVERVSEGWTVQRAAAAAGISRRTAHKWLERDASPHLLQDPACLGSGEGICNA